MPGNKIETLKVKIVKKSVHCKNGTQFVKFISPMYFANEAGEIEMKWVEVKFAKEVDLTPIKKVGYIRLHSDDIEAPTRYVIRDKVDKNGNKVEGKKSYPHIYVKRYESYETEPRPNPTQSMFVIDEDTAETDID